MFFLNIFIHCGVEIVGAFHTPMFKLKKLTLALSRLLWKTSGIFYLALLFEIPKHGICVSVEGKGIKHEFYAGIVLMEDKINPYCAEILQMFLF